MELLVGYLANIDFYTLLIGFNYENLSIIQHLSMNPHNSFIRFHYLTGIFAIYIYYKLCRILIKYLISNRLLLVVLSVLLLRGWTDSLYFFSMYDFVIYYILILESIGYNEKAVTDYKKNTNKIFCV